MPEQNSPDDQTSEVEEFHLTPDLRWVIRFHAPGIPYSVLQQLWCGSLGTQKWVAVKSVMENG